MDFKAKRETHKKIAMKALEISTEARDDDWAFIFQALEVAGVVNLTNYVRKTVIESGLNVNTLLRERQSIQNKEGLYQASEEVRARRAQKRKEYTDSYGSDN